MTSQHLILAVIDLLIYPNWVKLSFHQSDLQRDIIQMQSKPKLPNPFWDGPDTCKAKLYPS